MPVIPQTSDVSHVMYANNTTRTTAEVSLLRPTCVAGPLELTVVGESPTGVLPLLNLTRAKPFSHLWTKSLYVICETQGPINSGNDK